MAGMKIMVLMDIASFPGVVAVLGCSAVRGVMPSFPGKGKGSAVQDVLTFGDAVDVPASFALAPPLVLADAVLALGLAGLEVVVVVVPLLQVPLTLGVVRLVALAVVVASDIAVRAVLAWCPSRVGFLPLRGEWYSLRPYKTWVWYSRVWSLYQFDPS